MKPDLVTKKGVTIPFLFFQAKVGCAFPMVISSKFRMRQYIDGDHREEAPQFRNNYEIHS